MIRITIKGTPVPQGRPKFARRGSFVTAYDPKPSKDYKELVKAQALVQYQESPLEGALSCTVTIYRPIQQSGSKRQKLLKQRGQIRPTVKGDVDNYFKAVTDPLTGIAWVDDAQIVDAHIHKFYSDDPRVEVEITELWPKGN